jgi:low affinity Fe/Cu permease
MKLIERALTALGVLTARPLAFLAVSAYGLVWVVFDHGHFGFHEAAVLATWLMTLLIQRAEHRDTQALHAKLDELIRTHPDISNRMAGIDDREPEDIEAQRNDARQQAE